MNPLSGSTILWSILGEYEPFNVLPWYCKGLLSGSYGPKIGQNCMKYDILALLCHFHFKKIEINQYSGSTILWSILREYEPCNVLRW